ncbi:MAG TPA: hypothetical protein VFI14_00665 [Chryseosolibacter sp.]|nr:hypothetical protein [Chryseosolibacter sp.]
MPVTLATNVQAGDHRKLMLMRGGKNQNNCIVAGSAIGASTDQAVNAITVNRDVNSIIFLHACVNPARNDKAYRMIHDFDDTATLLGWYEITYEDGMIETVPIRYGVNILDWRWRQRISNHEPAKNKYSQDKYAYQASAVDCAGAGTEPVTFFCYEWLNPRLGKVVREVKLKSVARSDKGDNAIMVLAVSVATSTPSIPSTSSPRSSGQAGTSSPASSGQAGSGSPASESEEPKE